MSDVLTPEERQVAEDVYAETRRGGGGLLLSFMDEHEIKVANALVRRGVLYKGRSDDKQHSVTYFMNDREAKKHLRGER